MNGWIETGRYIRGEAERSSYVKRDVGNVMADTEITFEYGIHTKSRDLKGINLSVCIDLCMYLCMFVLSRPFFQFVPTVYCLSVKFFILFLFFVLIFSFSCFSFCQYDSYLYLSMSY